MRNELQKLDEKYLDILFWIIEHRPERVRGYIKYLKELYNQKQLAEFNEDLLTEEVRRVMRIIQIHK